MLQTLNNLAELLKAELVGEDSTIDRVASLEDARPGSLSLCLDLRNIEQLKKTEASAVLLSERNRDLISLAPCAVLLVQDTRRALVQVLQLYHPEKQVDSGVMPGASLARQAEVDSSVRVEAGARIAAGARVGANSRIESGAVIEAGARLGENCWIGQNAVVLGCCRLGDRVRIGPGTVLGSRGFGLIELDGSLKRIPQVGGVVLEQDVDLGANCTVDRATLGVTRIGRGSKLDNQIQVGHNVDIGCNVVIAAQVGLSGSVKIEDGVMLGGQVGVADHVTIGTGAQVGAKSGVGQDVQAKARVAGYPAVPVKEWLKSVFFWRRMNQRQKSFSGEAGEDLSREDGP